MRLFDDYNASQLGINNALAYFKPNTLLRSGFSIVADATRIVLAAFSMP
jgi:hypothetical protein